MSKIQQLLYTPDRIGILINPFYIARRELFKIIKKLGPSIQGKTLDVGCGQKPYEHLFNSTQYIGMDIKQSGHNHSNSKIDVFYDGKTFPFNTNEFDSVVTNQVLEHVFTPDLFLIEINRVLKPNGTLLLTVPFIWDEHEQPYDFGRYTSFGITHLLEKHGFETINIIKTNNNFRAIIQLTINYIFQICSINKATKIISLSLIIPLNIFGVILAFILPSNQNIYLDLIILAKKKNSHV